MSSFQSSEEKCPKCGKHRGYFSCDIETGDEWFACKACGWRYEKTLRRFGKESLATLRALLGTEPKPAREPKPPEWSLALDQLLAEIAEEWVKNVEPIKTLNSILKRPVAERTSSDWEFLVTISRKDDFGALDENGNWVFDYVEQAPKFVELPISKLRPMEELLEIDERPLDFNSRSDEDA